MSSGTPPIERAMPWTLAEDQTILRGLKEHGKLWKRIAQNVPGRTPSSVRNRYQRLIMRSHETKLEVSRLTKLPASTRVHQAASLSTHALPLCG